MPSRSSTLQALQAAAASWRRRDALACPQEVQRARLLQWLEQRDDQREPLAFEALNLSGPMPAGLPLPMPGDPVPWFTRLRLHCAIPAAWLPPEPLEGIHISRTAPQSLVWAVDREPRRFHCGALAFLRGAAAGSGPPLVWILKETGWPAAAALVERHQDDDEIYEVGAGRVPHQLPSPRRLLLAALGDRPRELEWIEELCDGADDWDSGEKALPVPRGEAVLPGQAPAPATWIMKL